MVQPFSGASDTVGLIIDCGCLPFVHHERDPAVDASRLTEMLEMFHALDSLVHAATSRAKEMELKIITNNQ